MTESGATNSADNAHHMDTPQLREHRLPHELHVSRWDRVRTRVLRSVGALIVLGLGLVAASLVVDGVDAFLDDVEAAGTPDQSRSNTGAEIGTGTEDGWRAIVEPTPTLLLLWVDDRGDLASASLASLGTASRVVVFPAELNLNVPGFTLQRAWQERGAQEVAELLAQHLGTGIQSTAVIDRTTWPELVGPQSLDVLLDQNLATRAPAASIAVSGDVASAASTDDGAVQRGFLAGPVMVRPDLAATFAGWVNEGEDPRFRLSRQVVLWDSLLQTVSDRPVDQAPTLPMRELRRLLAESPATNVTLGQVVGHLARTGAAVEAVSLLDGVSPGPVRAVDLDPPATAALLRDVVPRPAPVQTGAPTARLINGGNDDMPIDRVRSLIARGGLQLVSEGNDFGRTHRESRVVLHGEVGGVEAQQLASVLGVATVETDRNPDDDGGGDDVPVDITIVIGSDSVQTGTTN